MLLRKVERKDLETVALTMHMWHAIELVVIVIIEAVHIPPNIV